MKKALSLILALVLCLSLCACGTTNGDNTLDVKDAVIGTWKCYYELTKDSPPDNKAGDTYSQTIELYKGGTGKIYWYNETRNHEGNDYSLTWEIEDGVVNITYGIFGFNSYEGLEYDFETDTLTMIDGSKVFDRH